MAGLKWTAIELDKIQTALKEGMSYREISETVLPGRSVHSIRQQASMLGFSINDIHAQRIAQTMEPPRPRAISVTAIPKSTRTIEEIIQSQSEVFERKRESYNGSRCVEIEMSGEGPFGFMVFGDPHVDDAGTDIERFCSDLLIAKNHDHILAANIGDLTNNWVRALGHLHGNPNLPTSIG